METFYEYIDAYKAEMEKGVVPKAYKGLLEYLMSVRAYLAIHYPGYFVSSNIYTGYMDMSYFSVSPESLKRRKLKIAVVFIHETCRFEAWLAGINKLVQAQYWDLFRESAWDRYPIVPGIQGRDAIIEHTIVEHPNFADLDGLTKLIETETLDFIGNIDTFLASLNR